MDTVIELAVMYYIAVEVDMNTNSKGVTYEYRTILSEPACKKVAFEWSTPRPHNVKITPALFRVSPSSQKGGVLLFDAQIDRSQIPHRALDFSKLRWE